MDDVRELFDYFNDSSRSSIKIVIGQYISVIMKSIDSVEAINKINRIKIAEDFIKKKTNNGLYSLDYYYRSIREYTLDELIIDIAEFVDFKLPNQFWHKMYCLDHPNVNRHNIKFLYPGANEIKGFKFFYEINSLRDKYFTGKVESSAKKSLK